MRPPKSWRSISSTCKPSSSKVNIRTARRHHSTNITDPYPLPPIDEWRAHFPTQTLNVRERVSIRNPQTAEMLANSYFSPQSIAAGKNKVIIEAFPGPGQLSRALLRMPKSQVQRLIILEDSEPYLEYLRPLEADPRVTIVPLSGFEWDTYRVLEERGLLDEVETLPMDGEVHPQLHFISHIPHTIKGEQLVAQLFRCVPAGSWLFKYGRVPMSLILGRWLWERITAPIGTSTRCKVGVVAEATATLQNSVRPSTLLPYDMHFHPTVVKNETNKPESRRAGHPLCSVNIVPLAHQIITKETLEQWDYILRRLFVLKGTPLERAISSLAVGANTLLKTLTDENLPDDQRVNVKKRIRDLTVADWALISKAFYEWPFAPTSDDLAISGSFNRAEKLNRHGNV